MGIIDIIPRLTGYRLSMKRLLVLFLICLLPMQVFAGMVTYRAVLTQQLQPPAVVAVQAGHADDSDSGDHVGDVANADSEDFSYHAGLGDEPVLYAAVLFVTEASSLAQVLSSDAASQPPFLPPAGRPPRL